MKNKWEFDKLSGCCVERVHLQTGRKKIQISNFNIVATLHILFKYFLNFYLKVGFTPGECHREADLPSTGSYSKITFCVLFVNATHQ